MLAILGCFDSPEMDFLLATCLIWNKPLFLNIIASVEMKSEEGS